MSKAKELPDWWWPQKKKPHFIPCHFPHSKNSAVSKIIDARNAPVYREGDHIVIDPEVAPRSGDMVVVLIDDVPVLGKYARRGAKVELLSLNRKWPSLTLNKRRGDRIVGVVTEHAQPRRPASAKEAAHA